VCVCIHLHWFARRNKLSCHCRYWGFGSNTPYASTDASMEDSTGQDWIMVVDVCQADAAILPQPGRRGMG
jgi:hypothetical protein